MRLPRILVLTMDTWGVAACPAVLLNAGKTFLSSALTVGRSDVATRADGSNVKREGCAASTFF